MWRSALAVAVLMGAPAAWAQAQPEENPEIRAFHDAFFAAWNRGDLGALTDSLTTDTVYHPMNGTTLIGRATLARVYGEFLANFQVTMTVRAELLQATGRQGVMMGLYRATMMHLGIVLPRRSAAAVTTWRCARRPTGSGALPGS